jgi:hypothetical protein
MVCSCRRWRRYIPKIAGTNYAVREGDKIAQLIAKDLDGRTPTIQASGTAAEAVRLAS